MRVVLQYVTQAKVVVDSKTVGRIGQGYVLLASFGKNDTAKSIKAMVEKIIALRTIPDSKGKINLSIKDIQGELLVIPQFTLHANTHKGNRPSFHNSAPPQIASKLFKLFVSECKKNITQTKSGIFSAHMKIELTNDGPITIILEN